VCVCVCACEVGNNGLIVFALIENIRTMCNSQEVKTPRMHKNSLHIC
jgi:hypothetical protein